MGDDTAGLPLFGEYKIAPYRRQSATSLAAAKKVTPGVKAIHMLILSTIRKYGPMNADEVSAKLATSPLSVRPRFTDLHGEKGGLFLLEPTGEQRPSSLGNPMDVYRLSDKGRKHVGDDRIDSHHANTMSRSQRAG